MCGSAIMVNKAEYKLCFYVISIQRAV